MSEMSRLMLYAANVLTNDTILKAGDKLDFGESS